MGNTASTVTAGAAAPACKLGSTQDIPGANPLLARTAFATPPPGGKQSPISLTSLHGDRDTPTLSSAAARQEALNCILNVPLVDVVPAQSPDAPLCMLKENDVVLDALRTFDRHNISSIPIRFEGGHYALVDVNDLMAFFVAEFRKLGENADAFTASWRRVAESTPCRAVVNFSGGNPTVTVPHSLTVGGLIDQFATTRAYRFLVLDESGRLYQVITQTNLLHYLSGALPTLFPNPSQSLAQVDFFGGTAPRPLRTVDATTPAIVAWAQCVEWKVHRAAVTGGSKVGSFGTWNLAGALLHGRVVVRDAARTAVTVDLDDPLEAVVQRLATEAREVFLIDDGGVPLHVITQGDCIRFLLRGVAVRPSDVGASAGGA
ncbi:hypothetical protein GGF31_001034 [Allomyces arbusculus]|nr:hypothetical protein GGF31_001034 [Allomyces arbusculus]